jgi:hypothetical protein
VLLDELIQQRVLWAMTCITRRFDERRCARTLRVGSGSGHGKRPADRARTKQAMSCVRRVASAKLMASCRNDRLKQYILSISGDLDDKKSGAAREREFYRQIYRQKSSLQTRREIQMESENNLSPK